MLSETESQMEREENSSSNTKPLSGYYVAFTGFDAFVNDVSNEQQREEQQPIEVCTSQSDSYAFVTGTNAFDCTTANNSNDSKNSAAPVSNGDEESMPNSDVVEHSMQQETKRLSNDMQYAQGDKTVMERVEEANMLEMPMLKNRKTCECQALKLGATLAIDVQSSSSCLHFNADWPVLLVARRGLTKKRLHAELSPQVHIVPPCWLWHPFTSCTMQNEINDDSNTCNVLLRRYNEKFKNTNSVINIDNTCIINNSENDSNAINKNEPKMEVEITCANSPECGEVHDSHANKYDNIKKVCANEELNISNTLHKSDWTFMPYLYGYTFSSTLLSCAEREALQRILNENGAVLSSSLSTSCDALLINDDIAKLLRKWVKCDQSHGMRQVEKHLSFTKSQSTLDKRSNLLNSSHENTTQTAKNDTTCQRNTNSTVQRADNSMEFAPSEKMLFAWRNDIPVISYYRLFALTHVVIDLNSTTTTTTTSTINDSSVKETSITNRSTVHCVNLHSSNETSSLQKRQLDFDTIADTFSVPAPQLTVTNNIKRSHFPNKFQSNQQLIKSESEEFTSTEEFTSSEEDWEEEEEEEEEENEEEENEKEEELELVNVVENKCVSVQLPVAHGKDKRICHDATVHKRNENKFTLSLHDAIPEESNTLHVHNADEYMSFHDERKDCDSKTFMAQTLPFTELSSSSSSSSSVLLPFPSLSNESHVHSDHAADYFSMPWSQSFHSNNKNNDFITSKQVTHKRGRSEDAVAAIVVNDNVCKDENTHKDECDAHQAPQSLKCEEVALDKAQGSKLEEEKKSVSENQYSNATELSKTVNENLQNTHKYTNTCSEWRVPLHHTLRCPPLLSVALLGLSLEERHDAPLMCLACRFLYSFEATYNTDLVIIGSRWVQRKRLKIWQSRTQSELSKLQQKEDTHVSNCISACSADKFNKMSWGKNVNISTNNLINNNINNNNIGVDHDRKSLKSEKLSRERMGNGCTLRSRHASAKCARHFRTRIVYEAADIIPTFLEEQYCIGQERCVNMCWLKDCFTQVQQELETIRNQNVNNAKRNLVSKKESEREYTLENMYKQRECHSISTLSSEQSHESDCHNEGWLQTLSSLPEESQQIDRAENIQEKRSRLERECEALNSISTSYAHHDMNNCEISLVNEVNVNVNVSRKSENSVHDRNGNDCINDYSIISWNSLPSYYDEKYTVEFIKWPSKNKSTQMPFVKNAIIENNNKTEEYINCNLTSVKATANESSNKEHFGRMQIEGNSTSSISADRCFDTNTEMKKCTSSSKDDNDRSNLGNATSEDNNKKESRNEKITKKKKGEIVLLEEQQKQQQQQQRQYETERAVAARKVKHLLKLLQLSDINNNINIDSNGNINVSELFANCTFCFIDGDFARSELAVVRALIKLGGGQWVKKTSEEWYAYFTSGKLIHDRFTTKRERCKSKRVEYKKTEAESQKQKLTEDKTVETQEQHDCAKGNANTDSTIDKISTEPEMLTLLQNIREQLVLARHQHQRHNYRERNGRSFQAERTENEVGDFYKTRMSNYMFYVVPHLYEQNNIKTVANKLCNSNINKEKYNAGSSTNEGNQEEWHNEQDLHEQSSQSLQINLTCSTNTVTTLSQSRDKLHPSNSTIQEKQKLLVLKVLRRLHIITSHYLLCCLAARTLISPVSCFLFTTPITASLSMEFVKHRSNHLPQQTRNQTDLCSVNTRTQHNHTRLQNTKGASCHSVTPALSKWVWEWRYKKTRSVGVTITVLWECNNLTTKVHEKSVNTENTSRFTSHARESFRQAFLYCLEKVITHLGGTLLLFNDTQNTFDEDAVSHILLIDDSQIVESALYDVNSLDAKDGNVITEKLSHKKNYLEEILESDSICRPNTCEVKELQSSELETDGKEKCSCYQPAAIYNWIKGQLAENKEIYALCGNRQMYNGINSNTTNDSHTGNKHTISKITNKRCRENASEQPSNLPFFVTLTWLEACMHHGIFVDEHFESSYAVHPNDLLNKFVHNKIKNRDVEVESTEKHKKEHSTTPQSNKKRNNKKKDNVNGDSTPSPLAKLFNFHAPGETPVHFERSSTSVCHDNELSKKEQFLDKEDKNAEEHVENNCSKNNVNAVAKMSLGINDGDNKNDLCLCQHETTPTASSSSSSSVAQKCTSASCHSIKHVASPFRCLDFDTLTENDDYNTNDDITKENMFNEKQWCNDDKINVLANNNTITYSNNDINNNEISASFEQEKYIPHFNGSDLSVSHELSTQQKQQQKEWHYDNTSIIVNCFNKDYNEHSVCTPPSSSPPEHRQISLRVHIEPESNSTDDDDDRNLWNECTYSKHMMYSVTNSEASRSMLPEYVRSSSNRSQSDLSNVDVEMWDPLARLSQSSHSTNLTNAKWATDKSNNSSNSNNVELLANKSSTSLKTNSITTTRNEKENREERFCNEFVKLLPNTYYEELTQHTPCTNEEMEELMQLSDKKFMPQIDKEKQEETVSLPAARVNDKLEVGRPSIISVADSSMTIDDDDDDNNNKYTTTNAVVQRFSKTCKEIITLSDNEKTNDNDDDGKERENKCNVEPTGSVEKRQNEQRPVASAAVHSIQNETNELEKNDISETVRINANTLEMRRSIVNDQNENTEKCANLSSSALVAAALSTGRANVISNNYPRFYIYILHDVENKKEVADRLKTILEQCTHWLILFGLSTKCENASVVVTQVLNTRESVLLAIAAGKWVVHPEWLSKLCELLESKYHSERNKMSITETCTENRELNGNSETSTNLVSASNCVELDALVCEVERLLEQFEWGVEMPINDKRHVNVLPSSKCKKVEKTRIESVLAKQCYRHRRQLTLHHSRLFDNKLFIVLWSSVGACESLRDKSLCTTELHEASTSMLKTVDYMPIYENVNEASSDSKLCRSDLDRRESIIRLIRSGGSEEVDNCVVVTELLHFNVEGDVYKRIMQKTYDSEVSFVSELKLCKQLCMFIWKAFLTHVENVCTKLQQNNTQHNKAKEIVVLLDDTLLKTCIIVNDTYLLKFDDCTDKNDSHTDNYNCNVNREVQTMTLPEWIASVNQDCTTYLDTNTEKNPNVCKNDCTHFMKRKSLLWQMRKLIDYFVQNDLLTHFTPTETIHTTINDHAVEEDRKNMSKCLHCIRSANNSQGALELNTLPTLQLEQWSQCQFNPILVENYQEFVELIANSNELDDKSNDDNDNSALLFAAWKRGKRCLLLQKDFQLLKELLRIDNIFIQPMSWIAEQICGGTHNEGTCHHDQKKTQIILPDVSRRRNAHSR